MPTTWNWIGSAAAIPQVDVRVPAAINIGNDFSITRNGKSVTFRATAVTAVNVTAGLAAAVAASSIPEFANEITATDLVGTISFTAKTPGKPFPATYSAAVGTGGGAPTFAASGVQTPSGGPNHFDSLGNWRDNAGNYGIPVNGDSLIFENSTVPLLYSLDQHLLTMVLVDVRDTYKGFIGLPRYTGTYQEDRETYFRVGATTLRIRGGGGRIKIDTGAAQSDVNVIKTGSPLESGIPAFLWKGTHVANTFQITKGYAGVAFFSGEAAALADLNVGFQTARDSDSNLWCGPGVTLSATIDKSGGTLYLASPLITFAQEDGVTYLTGDALNVTTLKLTGGKFFYQSNGVITTLNGYDDAAIDFNGDLRGKTVTNCNWYGDLRNIIDEWTSVIWTNAINALGPTPLNLGEKILIQVTKL